MKLHPAMRGAHEQVELIDNSGCAHSWTQIYVAKNTAPPQSLPDIDRRVIAYVCLRCGSYRPAIADHFDEKEGA